MLIRLSINEETIGFSIAPRINAAGRLDSADPAVYLLLAEDAFEAEALAEDIEQLNKDRKELVNTISEEAIQMVEQNFPTKENSSSSHWERRLESWCHWDCCIKTGRKVLSTNDCFEF